MNAKFVNIVLIYFNLLFFPTTMKKTGPFKACLFASNPKNGGNTNYESHQVFHQKENQIRTTHVSDLQGGKEKYAEDIKRTFY